MSDSLQPWIAQYIVEAAETYGASISSIPFYPKRKKVQIIEFLTYSSDEQDTQVWARVSDKQHIINILFTKEAVKEFYALNRRRLTENKGAIVTIARFKPSFSRYPLGNAKMSVSYSVGFECEKVSLLGSAGESTFGNPKQITSHPDVNAWSEGLAKDGGAANILKQRKMEKGAAPRNLLPPMPSPPTPPQADPPQIPLKRVEANMEKAYQAKWQFLRNREFLRLPEKSDVVPTLEVQPATRSSTPIPSKASQNESQEARSPNGRQTSSIPAPTPAQRPRPIPETPAEFSSSYALGNETVLGSDHAGSQSQESSRAARSVARKIPRPVSPELPEQTGRVLAPNSDTSGTQPSQPPPGGVLLGGCVAEPNWKVPWMSIRDIGAVLRRTAELRLSNSVM